MKKNYYINPEIEVLAAMNLPAFPEKTDPDFRVKFAAYQAAKDAITMQARRVVAAGITIMETIPYCNVPVSEDLFRRVFGISISVMSEDDKLAGLRSINSAVTENVTCLFRMQCKETVCSHCYAAGILAFRKGLKDNTELNGRILQAAEIPVRFWPVILDRYFRIESFADVANTTHARNYCNFMRKNIQCDFAAWTKNPAFWDRAMRTEDGAYCVPANCSFVLSSRVLNRPEDGKKVREMFPWIDAIFTVFSLDYAADNNVQITCGGRKCRDCMKCYTAKDHSADGVIYVHELLKVHQKVARRAFYDRRKVFRITIGKTAENKPVQKTYYHNAAAAVLAYIDAQVKRGMIAV